MPAGLIIAAGGKHEASRFPGRYARLWSASTLSARFMNSSSSLGESGFGSPSASWSPTSLPYVEGENLSFPRCVPGAPFVREPSARLGSFTASSVASHTAGASSISSVGISQAEYNVEKPAFWLDLVMQSVQPSKVT